MLCESCVFLSTRLLDQTTQSCMVCFAHSCEHAMRPYHRILCHVSSVIISSVVALARWCPCRHCCDCCCVIHTQTTGTGEWQLVQVGAIEVANMASAVLICVCVSCCILRYNHYCCLVLYLWACIWARCLQCCKLAGSSEHCSCSSCPVYYYGCCCLELQCGVREGAAGAAYSDKPGTLSSLQLQLQCGYVVGVAARIELCFHVE
jgi:hypothetical protein